jgi:hypothetical protein
MASLFHAALPARKGVVLCGQTSLRRMEPALYDAELTISAGFADPPQLQPAGETARNGFCEESCSVDIVGFWTRTG